MITETNRYYSKNIVPVLSAAKAAKALAVEAEKPKEPVKMKDLDLTAVIPMLRVVKAQTATTSQPPDAEVQKSTIAVS